MRRFPIANYSQTVVAWSVHVACRRAPEAAACPARHARPGRAKSPRQGCLYQILIRCCRACL